MESEDIISSNKMIAEFMGAERVKKPYGNTYSFKEGNTPTKYASYFWDSIALQYHSSWDWQIPVWQKLYKEVHEWLETLEDERYNIKAVHFFRLREKYHKVIDEGTKLQGFELIIEILNWYNQNKS